MPAFSEPLRVRCGICDSSTNLLRCGACKAISYCSKEHQIADRAQHRAACKAVKKAQTKVDDEVTWLGQLPEHVMVAPRPFENCVGRFWGIPETRSYMRARGELVETLLEIKTYDAVNAAYANFKECLRLGCADKMGHRWIMPLVLMRLDRDQEISGFLKWWKTEGKIEDWDSSGNVLPYLDACDANVFKEVGFVCDKNACLVFKVTATLLKIRLLLDLSNLRNVPVDYLERKSFPPELVEKIKRFVVHTSMVLNDRQLFYSNDNSEIIHRLEDQIMRLFLCINESNEYFWTALLNPKEYPKERPLIMDPGSKEEVQMVLMFSLDAWSESPGALDFIKSMCLKHLSPPPVA